MSHLTLRRALYSEQDTRDLAASLARLARPGDVIALEGDLGAGKTVFARAFVTALGGEKKFQAPHSPLCNLMIAPQVPFTILTFTGLLPLKIHLSLVWKSFYQMVFP